MSTFSRLKKRRVRDFERRCRMSKDVRRYREWRYLTIHPFADEAAILDRLGIRPDDCTLADVWWHHGQDVALLQIVANPNRTESIVALWFGTQYLAVYVTLPTSNVSIEDLHDLMDQISRRGLPKRFCGQVKLLSKQGNEDAKKNPAAC